MLGIKNQGTGTLRVMELFAGVGGFRQGLEQVRTPAQQAAFKVVWANQYEPASKKQWAAEVYRARWGVQDLVNEDIFEVLQEPALMASLDALCPDVLVGGFPCQDYSVAKPLSHSQGLQGDKGVMWWAVSRMLQARRAAGAPLKYLVLENVDRLLSSPATCPGQDFARILVSLQQEGYAVEWRVVNAADYGFAQKRRRLFMVAAHESTPLYTRMAACAGDAQQGSLPWLLSAGVLAKALPARLKDGGKLQVFSLPVGDWAAMSYVPPKRGSGFASAGVCAAGLVCTAPLVAQKLTDCTEFTGLAQALTLGDVVRETGEAVAPAYFLADAALPKWQRLKAAKSSARVSAHCHAYHFSEGAMAFPDRLDAPARTVITSEGGAGASRTTHVVRHADGRLRRLVPEELEVLNGFARGFTDIAGITLAKRGFLMGNALVTGLVTAIGRALWQAQT